MMKYFAGVLARNACRSFAQSIVPWPTSDQPSSSLPSPGLAMSLTWTATMRLPCRSIQAQRIGAAAHDPGDVHLPADVGRRRQDVLLRHRAVGKRLELEVVIVPGEAVAVLLRACADGGEPLAETAPAGGVASGRSSAIEVGADHGRDAERIGDLSRAVEVVLQHVDGEMRGRHRQTVAVQFLAEGRRVRIDAAEAFDLRCSRLGRAASAPCPRAGSCGRCRAALTSSCHFLLQLNGRLGHPSFSNQIGWS